MSTKSALNHPTLH